MCTAPDTLQAWAYSARATAQSDVQRGTRMQSGLEWCRARVRRKHIGAAKCFCWSMTAAKEHPHSASRSRDIYIHIQTMKINTTRSGPRLVYGSKKEN